MDDAARKKRSLRILSFPLFPSHPSIAVIPQDPPLRFLFDSSPLILIDLKASRQSSKSSPVPPSTFTFKFQSHSSKQYISLSSHPFPIQSNATQEYDSVPSEVFLSLFDKLRSLDLPLSAISTLAFVLFSLVFSF